MALIARAAVGEGLGFGELVGDEFFSLTGNPFARMERSGEVFSIADTHLVSPTEPGKLLIQLGGFLPKNGSELTPSSTPQFMAKLTSTVSGNDGEIVIPASISRVWVEVEVAIVIGKTVSSASENEATNAIYGYTCFNDVTAPEYLALPTKDYWRAKSIDTFASMGPWIRTDLLQADFTRGLQMVARVNGVEVAGGNTRYLKYRMGEVVASASKNLTLSPGDVISLGTPKPCEVRPGDTVELEIEGIGTLRNHIVAA